MLDAPVCDQCSHTGPCTQKGPELQAESSMATFLKLLIILWLNLCFISAYWWDSGALVRVWSLGTCTFLSSRASLTSLSIPLHPGNQVGPGWGVGRVEVGQAHSEVSPGRAQQWPSGSRAFHGWLAGKASHPSHIWVPMVSWYRVCSTLACCPTLGCSRGLGQWACGKGRCQGGVSCSQMANRFWVLQLMERREREPRSQWVSWTLSSGAGILGTGEGLPLPKGVPH